MVREYNIRKGKALVALVCVQEYQPYGSSENNLNGTLVERSLLKQLFEKEFGYKVIVPQNEDGLDLNRVTRSDFVRFIEKVKNKYLNTDEYDAFIFIFSGHGDQNTISLSDHKTKEVHQGKYGRIKLYKYFNGLQCPSFKDKPKMLLFEACKGGDEAPDLNVARPNVVARAVENAAKLSQAPDDNIIVVDSNSDGYVSWDDKNGGFLLQSLIEVMSRRKSRMGLDEISKLITIGVKQLNNHVKRDMGPHGIEEKRATETVVFKYYGVNDDIYFCK